MKLPGKQFDVIYARWLQGAAEAERRAAIHQARIANRRIWLAKQAEWERSLK